MNLSPNRLRIIPKGPAEVPDQGVEEEPLDIRLEHAIALLALEM
jgi:hypothetical protein